MLVQGQEGGEGGNGDAVVGLCEGTERRRMRKFAGEASSSAMTVGTFRIEKEQEVKRGDKKKTEKERR